MSHPFNAFSVSSGTTPIVSSTPLTYGPTDSTTNSIGVFPEAYANATTPLYAPAGSAGGAGVESVSGTLGQITVASGTTNAVVGLASVGTAGVKSNVSSITTDAQGRITASTSLGYTPANPANFVPVTGGTFTGLVSGVTPTDDANLATKGYVDSQIPDVGVLTVTAGDSSITIGGTDANPTVSVTTQAGVTAGSYTSANLTVDAKGIITAVSNGASPGDVSQWATFPAVQNVEMNAKNITSTAQLDVIAPEINLNQTTALGDAPLGDFPFTTFMNLTASGGIGIVGGLGVGIDTPGVVQIAGATNVNISSLGNITIGSSNVGDADTEIEHIAFKDNLIYKYTPLVPGPNPDIIITDVDTINTVGFSSTGDISTTGDIETTGFVGANILKLANEAPLPAEISNFQIGTDHIISLTNSTVPLADKPALLDTVFNKPTLGLAGSTLSLNAKKNDGTATELSTVDLSTVPSTLFTKYDVKNLASGSTYNLTVAESGTIIMFNVNTAGVGVVVTLPSGGDVPLGTAFFIQNKSTSEENIRVTPSGTGIGIPFNIAIGGGAIAICNNNVGGITEYAISDSLGWKPELADYVPLAGTLAGSPMTGTLVVDDSTNIESKNITTALITPLSSVGYVSVLGPAQVEGGNFLIANPAGSEIGLASSASPAPGEVATIAYNYSVDDNLHINKKVISDVGVMAPSVEASTTLTVDSINVKDLITFKDARTFYVSKQGSDSNDGSVLAPKLTVQAAINDAISSGLQCVIAVGPGTFTESLTIASTVGLIIKGQTQSDRNIEGTHLAGQITVNVSNVDNMNNNQVVISGCFVEGSILDQSSKQHTLIVDNCRIEADSALGAVAIQSNQTATDSRIYIQDCVITQEAGSSGSNSLVSSNVGFVYIQRCDMSVRTDGAVVDINGTASLTNMNNSGLSSSSTSSTAGALLRLASVGKTHAVGICAFQYLSTTAKTNSPAIRFQAASQTGILSNNTFSLAGTGSSNLIMFDVGSNPILVVGNNRAVAGTASTVQSGAVVSVLSYVGENVVQSVTAGSGISVSGGSGSTPSISNTGVLELTAGSNITITGSKSNYTISSSGGGGGGVTSLNSKTGALSILAGTGITIDNTVSDEITINSTNTAVVESVTGGNGISVDNTDPANPIVSVSTTGTIETSVIDVNGTGSNFSTFGTYPRVGGSYVPPTQPLELAPVQYVDDKPIGVATFNTLIGDVVLSAGTNISLGTVGNTITVNNTAPAGISSVSGTAPISVANGTTTPVVSLNASGVTANTYGFPSSVAVDTFGRVTAITAGTNPSGTFLPLAGGTMSGPINMGAQQITNAGAITTTGVVAGALSLPNATSGGTAGITALQTDTNGIASNNMYITQTSGALSLFKPLANPVIIYSAGISANLFTYLVPQFYGERHIFTGSAVSPILNYNTNANYTVGGNSISMNPFYVELTNGSTSTLTVKVRYPSGGIPPAQFPPLSTAPTTVAPSGTWADQTILPVGLVGTTTPTIASGGTKRLFFNGTSWYLI